VANAREGFHRNRDPDRRSAGRLIRRSTSSAATRRRDAGRGFIMRPAFRGRAASAPGGGGRRGPARDRDRGRPGPPRGDRPDPLAARHEHLRRDRPRRGGRFDQRSQSVAVTVRRRGRRPRIASRSAGRRGTEQHGAAGRGRGGRTRRPIVRFSITTTRGRRCR
jgi:hypothetical protein